MSRVNVWGDHRNRMSIIWHSGGTADVNVTQNGTTTTYEMSREEMREIYESMRLIMEGGS